MPRPADRGAFWRRRGRALAMLVVASIAGAVVALGGSGGPAIAAPDLSIEASCTPVAMRPDEYAVATCRFLIENLGEEIAGDLRLKFDFAEGLTSPLEASISAFDLTASDEPKPFDVIPLSSELPDLAAGQVLDIEFRVIFRAPHEDYYGAKVELRQNEQVMDTDIMSWAAKADAAYPPTKLVVTSTLLTESQPVSLSSPGAPVAETVEYELAVLNRSGAMRTAVVVLDKYSPNVVVVSSDPLANAVDSETHLARWVVGSLAPGEEARIRVTFAPVSGCASLSTAMVVTAQAGATRETYAARPQDNVAVGASGCGQVQGAGYGLPNGGAGTPEEGTTASPFEVAIALVFVGALAIAAAAGIHRARRR